MPTLEVRVLGGRSYHRRQHLPTQGAKERLVPIAGQAVEAKREFRVRAAVVDVVNIVAKFDDLKLEGRVACPILVHLGLRACTYGATPIHERAQLRLVGTLGGKELDSLLFIIL